jgi:hypothetical protein
MTKHRYILDIVGEKREFVPIGNFGLEEVFQPLESNRFSFIPKMDKMIAVTGDDFWRVYNFDNSPLRCSYIYLEIQRECSGSWATYNNYRIPLNNCEFDVDRCTAYLQLELMTNYICYDDNKKSEVDLFLHLPNRQTLYFTAGVIEVVEYTGGPVGGDFWRASAFPEPNPQTKGWVRTEYFRHFTTPNPTHTYKYAREKVIVTCDVVMPPEWILLVDNCSVNNTRTYVRPALIVAGYKYLNISDQFENKSDQTPVPSNYEPKDFDLVKWTVLGGTALAGIDNGLLLSDVLNYYSEAFCGKPTRSNFLQVNPTLTFAAAYPGLQPKISERNLIFQKSDITHATTAENSTKAVLVWEKLIACLCNIYNLNYEITEEIFLIEHISYFGRSVGIDSTIAPYNTVSQRSRYKYNADEFPELEEFSFMEQSHTDFVGRPIVYKGACVKKGDKKPYSIDIITTDMEYLITDGIYKEDAKGGGNVSDSGFVLVATELINGRSVVISRMPLLDHSRRANNVLGWSFLHDYFWRWERPLKNGYMNDLPTIFNTVKPSRYGEPISFPICCGDSVKLTDLIKTKLGDAYIAEAKYNLTTSMFTFTPAYVVNTENFICHAVKSFAFVSRDGNVFTFNTQFLTVGVSVTVLEWRKDTGPWYALPAQNETAGISTVALPTVTQGVYYFRKRVICNTETSDWSTVVNVPVETCSLQGPLATYNGMNNAGNPPSTKTFLFRSPRSQYPTNIYIPKREVQITLPDGTVQQRIYTSFLPNDATYFNWKIDVVYPAGGTYKFKFRYYCNNTDAGLWSAEVIVNI